MLQRRLSAGIEFGAYSARVAVVALRGTPTVVGCEEIVVEAGQEMQLGALAAKALDRLGGGRANVHLAYLPAQVPALRHHLFAGPRLKRSELSLVAARELKKEGAGDASRLYVGVEPQGTAPAGQDGKALTRYLLVSLAHAPLDETAPALLEARKLVRSATSSAMGLLRAAPLAGLPEKGCVALAQIDAARSSLVVLEDGVPQFFRDLPAPGGARDPDQMAQALARELDISLVYFAQTHRPKTVESLMVVGEAEVAGKVCDILEDSRTYAIQRFGPGPRLAAGPKAPASLAPFAAAIGVALGARGRTVPNLLPPELYARPERPLALGVGAVAVAAFLGAVVHLRGVEVERLSVERARLEKAQQEFSQLEKVVTKAASLDEAAARAAEWKELFERYGDYQKNVAKLLLGLPGTMPAAGRLGQLVLGPDTRAAARMPQPGAAPAPPAEADARLHLEGIVRAGDLQAAQSDLRQLVKNLEQVPGVKTAELLPVRATEAVGGVLELPFTLDAFAHNPFPAAAAPVVPEVRR